MVKFFLFIQKKNGITKEGFIDYYEKRHAPLGISLAGKMLDYRRNYIEREQGVFCPSFDADVISQICHDNPATFREQISKRNSQPTKDIMDADERNFMEPAGKKILFVEERALKAPKSGFQISRGEKLYKYMLIGYQETAGSSSEGCPPEALAIGDILNAAQASNVIECRRNHCIEAAEYLPWQADNPAPDGSGNTPAITVIDEIWTLDPLDMQSLAKLATSPACVFQVTEYISEKN